MLWQHEYFISIVQSNHARFTCINVCVHVSLCVCVCFVLFYSFRFLISTTPPPLPRTVCSQSTLLTYISHYRLRRAHTLINRIRLLLLLFSAHIFCFSFFFHFFINKFNNSILISLTAMPLNLKWLIRNISFKLVCCLSMAIDKWPLALDTTEQIEREIEK